MMYGMEYDCKWLARMQWGDWWPRWTPSRELRHWIAREAYPSGPPVIWLPIVMPVTG